MQWHEAVELLTPHVVKVITPTGFGTGFLLHRGGAKGVCSVATAYHVISHAYQWAFPIRIEVPSSGKSLLLAGAQRAILVDELRDTAAIVFDPSDLLLPPTPAPLIPDGKFLKVGVAVGWLGFPSVAATTLCFFSGRISAFREPEHTYYVDGVAINGVSGGPTFFVAEGDPAMPPHVVGIVSAYMSNVTASGALPGLAVVRDVQPFQMLTKVFQSVDEAREKQAENPPVQPAPPLPTVPGNEPTRGA